MHTVGWLELGEPQRAHQNFRMMFRNINGPFKVYFTFGREVMHALPVANAYWAISLYYLICLNYYFTFTGFQRKAGEFHGGSPVREFYHWGRGSAPGCGVWLRGTSSDRRPPGSVHVRDSGNFSVGHERPKVSRVHVWYETGGHCGVSQCVWIWGCKQNSDHGITGWVYLPTADREGEGDAEQGVPAEGNEHEWRQSSQRGSVRYWWHSEKVDIARSVDDNVRQ